IRLARAAARRLAQGPATGSPQAAARAALMAAARQYAPGLIRMIGTAAPKLTNGPASEGGSQDAQEAELSARLLEITDEAELDQFLGGLVSSIGRAASGFFRSDAGRALTGALKDVAGQALPTVGGALGGAFGGAAGRDLGTQLGSAARSIFGLEME